MKSPVAKSVGIYAFTNDLPWLDTGVTQYNVELTSQLCKKYPAVDFTVYLADENSKRLDGINEHNLTKVVLPKVDINNSNSLRKIAKLICTYVPTLKVFNEYRYFQNAPKHDVYVYTVYATSTWFPYFVKRKLNAPCIAVIHDVRFLKKQPKSLFERLRKRYEIKVFRNLCQSAAALLFPSHNAIETSRKTLPIEGKFFKSFSIPSHLNCSSKSERISKVISRDPYFFFPATVVDTKNHMFLVEVFSVYLEYFPGTKLIFCGSNTTSLLWSKISEKISELNLTEAIIHKGFVSEAEKNMFFEGAIAAVFPTEKESFNLGIWESFECSCPVIISNDSELIEQAGNAALVGDLQSPESFVTLMIELTKNEDSRNKLTAAGTSRLRECKNNALLSGWDEIFFTR